VTNAQSAQQAHKDYLQSRVLSAHPVEVVYMLYEVAIDSVKLAIKHLKAGHIMARGQALNKAQDAVQELNLSLDHTVNAPFVERTAGLYGFVRQRLLQGHMQQAEKPMQEALAVLVTLFDAWKEVKERVCGSSGVAVPEETQAPVQEQRREPQPVNRPYAAYASMSQGAVTSRDWSA
jgi:flagellar biosynthetic protein FliS